MRQPEKRRGNAFDQLRAARHDTIARVAELDQAQLDAKPLPERWSIGEILDHLVRADEMFLGEIHTLLEKQRQGRAPFVYRGLRDIDAPLSSLPWPFRLPIEGALAFWNATIPPVAREWAIGQRRFRAKAPEMLTPRPGRWREDLLADLRASLEEVDRLEQDPGLGSAVYYSPVVGFSGIVGLIRLIAQHDRRHQQQLEEARRALSGDARHEPFVAEARHR